MRSIVKCGLTAAAVASALVFVASASAAGEFRNCGDLPANAPHNTITGVKARNIACRNARTLTLRAFFACQRSGCRLSGGWRCTIASRYEMSTFTCSRRDHHQAVRFSTGV